MNDINEVVSCVKELGSQVPIVNGGTAWLSFAVKDNKHAIKNYIESIIWKEFYANEQTIDGIKITVFQQLMIIRRCVRKFNKYGLMAMLYFETPDNVGIWFFQDDTIYYNSITSDIHVDASFIGEMLDNKFAGDVYNTVHFVNN